MVDVMTGNGNAGETVHLLACGALTEKYFGYLLLQGPVSCRGAMVASSHPIQVVS